MALPPFVEGAIEPLLDLFSYVGIPVQKRQFNEFGERIITDYDDSSQPRQWYDSDLYEIPAHVQQINVPRAKITVNPSFQTVSKFVPFNNDERIELNDNMPVSELNCGPEISIMLINMNNNRSFIMSTPNQSSDISLYPYRKVSEMDLRMFNGMGRYTLETFLKEISEAVGTDPMVKLIERPRGILTQGGKLNINSAPSAIPFDESAKNNNNENKICSQCPEYIKKRPRFPRLSIIDE